MDFRDDDFFRQPGGDHLDDGLIGQDVGSLALSDVVAGGACTDTAIARVMISAGTSNGRSRLGDMVDLPALNARLAGSVKFFPLGSFGLGNQKADVLSENRLDEAGKAASDSRA